MVIAHSAPLLGPLANKPYGRPIGVILQNLYPLGVLGVELFFVLSGFLIGNILVRTFINTPDFSPATVRDFWIRRWFRTLPNYWLVLTVNLILYWSLGLTRIDSYKLLFYFFLQNLWYPHPPFFFGEAWSLSVEEWFYLTLPVAMLASSVIFRPHNKKRFLLRVFIGYLFTFLMLRFLNAFHPINGPDQDQGIRKVVVFRLDAVMYGVFMAFWNFFYPSVLNRMKGWLLGISALGAIIIFYLFCSPSVNISNAQNPTIRFLSDAFLYTLIPLTLSLCLPFANSVKTSRSRFGKAIIHISKISYSMYLVHFSLTSVLLLYYVHVDSAGESIGIYIAYWIGILTLSSLLYKYFELPVMKVRDKFKSEVRKQPV